MVQELGGGEAVLRPGELATVVLEEGQQVRLQVKQPVGGGPGVSPGCQPRRPWLPEVGVVVGPESCLTVAHPPICTGPFIVFASLFFLEKACVPRPL